MKQALSFLIFLFLLSLGSPAHGQASQLLRLEGEVGSDSYGKAIASAGDVDGDGLTDVIVGAFESSSARVLSGADGSVLHKFSGTASLDRFGFSVGGAGDVNNDGFDDVIVGAPLAFDAFFQLTGIVKVYSGFDGSELYHLTGVQANDSFGYSVSGCGDLNADGHDDFLVGAYEATVGGSYGLGSAYVYSGIDGSQLYQYDGGPNQDFFGSSVAGGGDIDNDGTPDFLVGTGWILETSGTFFGEGAVYAYSGIDGSLIHQVGGALQRYGPAVADAGDVNADGYDDFVVGNPTDWTFIGGQGAGSVTVFSGFDASILHQIDGATGFDRLGFAVSGAGDINNDGFADFVAGADQADPNNPGAPGAGRMVAYSGFDGSTLLALNGSQPGDRFGAAIAGLADANGDGHEDICVGSPLGDGVIAADVGLIEVFSTQGGGLLFSDSGGIGSNWYATTVSGAGDINGDGIPDLLVGDPYASPSSIKDAGSAFAYSGADGSLLYRIDGTSASEHAGQSVSFAGDINGDGRDDFLVGAPNAAPGGIAGAGTATLYSGMDGSVLFQWSGAVFFDSFGVQVSGAGDVDQDGTPDVLISATGADPGGMSFAGSAYVYSGATGLLLHQFDGTAAGDVLGSAVASAGDVNADGHADILLGARSADPGGFNFAGSAYVYSGIDGSLLYQYDGTAITEFVGSAVEGIGDLDNDGHDDFAIGAEGSGLGGAVRAGSIYLYSGIDGSLIRRLDGTDFFERLGANLADIGDLDGDGTSDLLAGTSTKDVGSLLAAGVARVFSGADGSVLLTLDGEAEGDNFGAAVAAAGDINQDGTPDLFIGANSVDIGGIENVGVACVFTLGPVPPVLVLTGTCPGSIDVSLSGATASGTLALAYGPAGTFVIPSGPCAGTVLAIGSPTLAGFFPADASGNLNLTTPPLPSAFCGLTLQAVDMTTCLASNPETF